MDLEKLRTFIKDSGVKVTSIAEKFGLTRQAFYAKLSGNAKFTADELCELACILRMNKDEIFNIFFAEYVRKNAIS
jgi:transcriptional regulator with XRE-family HTH domain